MKNKLLIWIAFFSCLSFYTQAQDPQLSQFYASPLFTNPANAGSDGLPRFVLNWRNQWPNLDATFVTYSGSFDFFLPEYNSGIGLMFNRDEAASAGYQSHDLALQYAYLLKLDNRWKVRAGMQFAYTIRDFSFSNLIFGDQLDDDGNIKPISQEQIPYESRRFVNVSSGFMAYSDKYWVGLSVHNMNRPRQDILDVGASRVPVRYTVQLGAKFPLNRYENWRDKYKDGYREKSISPTLLYKKQGPFDQLDLGVYFTYQPIVFGLWYRGLPIKEYKIGIGNNESLIALVGFQLGKMNIGYSYDFTISSLGPGTGGAHELSLKILFDEKQRKGVKKILNADMPCPKF